jgi:hypothetical protein
MIDLRVFNTSFVRGSPWKHREGQSRTDFFRPLSIFMVDEMLQNVGFREGGLASEFASNDARRGVCVPKRQQN